MRPKSSRFMKAELMVLLAILLLKVIDGQTNCVFGATAGAFKQAAGCYGEINQAEKSIVMLEEIEEMFPGYHGAHAPLVMHYMAVERYEEAILRLNQFDDPTEAAMLWQHLGKTWGSRGYLEEAIIAFKKAHSLNPNR